MAAGQALLIDTSAAITLGDLQVQGRKDVTYTFSMHACKEVMDGLRVHLVLKFKYDADLIEPVFGAKKPADDYEKRYSEAHRLFPYCVFNSLSEEPVSWTYQNTNGRVYERIELIVTLTKLTFNRYFPQVLNVCYLKVGSDGTAKTGIVNLLPEMQKNGKPNIDVSAFSKETSEFQLDQADTRAFVMKTYVRDCQMNTMGNLSGIYTRVYAMFVFEDDNFQNRFRYTVLSLVIVNTLAILGMEETPTDAAKTGLGITFLEIGLLFSLPNQEMTTATMVIIAHTLYELFMTLAATVMLWMQQEDDSISIPVMKIVLASNAVATFVTLCFKYVEMSSFKKLKTGLVDSMHGDAGNAIGSFDNVDKIV